MYAIHKHNKNSSFSFSTTNKIERTNYLFIYFTPAMEAKAGTEPHRFVQRDVT